MQERTAELNTANENLRHLSSRLLHLQDEERRRIARELHDSVGQLLAAISMNINTIQAQSHNLTADAARAVADNARLLDRVSAEIRTLSYLLHPPLLEIAGLASAGPWKGHSDGEITKTGRDGWCRLRRYPGAPEGV